VSGYYGDEWLGYIAELKRPDIEPSHVLKVGITNAVDPMYRLTYRGADELHPITNYFTEINILKIVKLGKSKFDAERWERRIMGMVKRKFNSPRFHNWVEDDRISGITEMRIWLDEEAEYILSVA
jgi:hypothetical protein